MASKYLLYSLASFHGFALILDLIVVDLSAKEVPHSLQLLYLLLHFNFILLFHSHGRSIIEFKLQTFEISNAL